MPLGMVCGGGTSLEALLEGGWGKTLPWTSEIDCHKANCPCCEQLDRTCTSQKDQGPQDRIHLQKIEFHTNFSMPTCHPKKRCHGGWCIFFFPGLSPITVNETNHCSENSRRLWLFPGSLRGFSRKAPGKSGKLLENIFSRIAKYYKFWDFRHRKRQTCREPWVHTAGTSSPPSVRDVF